MIKEIKSQPGWAGGSLEPSKTALVNLSQPDGWPKRTPKHSKNISNNKEITISILEPINPGMNKEEFLAVLENKIYSELDKIN